MPSRAAHLVAFLTIVPISVSAHVYIYRQLRRVIQRDFPKQKGKLLTTAKILFFYFDLPFVYLFFGKQITFDATALTQLLMYPFAVWQILMMVWAAILLPLGVIRSRWSAQLMRSTRKLIVKPIMRYARRLLNPRREINLETSEELG